MLTGTAGGAINLYASAELDGATRGAITLTGPVTVQDNQAVYGIGSITDNTLTINANADFRIQGANNLTLTGGTTTLVADNTRIYGDVSHRHPDEHGHEHDPGTRPGRRQHGLPDQRGADHGQRQRGLSHDRPDRRDRGRSRSNEHRHAARGERRNAAAPDRLFRQLVGTHHRDGAGSSVTITNGAVIQGGVLTGTAGGAINLYASTELDGATRGAMTLTGPVTVQDNQTVYGIGSITDNTLTINPNADFRIQGANNLTLTGGTTTLAADNTRIFGDVSTDILTNTATNTIQGRGQLGVNTRVRHQRRPDHRQRQRHLSDRGPDRR